MVNIALLWYFLIPLALSIATIFIVRKLMIKQLELAQIVGFTAGGLIISMVIMASAFYAGKGSKTGDVEILNGEVLRKDRIHDSYVRSYQCNCYTTTDSDGHTTEHCSTCYEDHYTVDWTCSTNIGNYTIKSLDETSKRVYKSPDPQRWLIIKPGDPVSGSHGYTNYIKAVPSSLFRPASATLKERYAGQIPAYPGNVYDFYHVDRVLPVGVSVPNLREWNTKLSEALKKLGPQKQANAVIVLTKYPSDDYFFALQDAWNNGKKNDIVVVIGAPDFPAKAAWVRIMALTKDEMFQVKLRDSILALDALTADAVIGAINAEGFATFKRKPMSDFKYLEAEIDPPSWVMTTASILITLAYLGFWIFAFVNRDARSFNSYGIPRFRRY